MRKMVVLAAALLVLTGCAAPTVEESVEPETVQETEISPAPLAADQSEEDESDLPLKAAPEPEPESPEVTFLATIRNNTDRPTLMSASDEQLLDAGRRACDQLAENPAINEVQVIDGEVLNDKGQYRDSLAIAASARANFCPDIQVVISPPTP